jgi:hypothetical protein
MLDQRDTLAICRNSPQLLECLSYPKLDPDSLRCNAEPASTEVPADPAEGTGRGLGSVPEVPRFNRNVALGGVE